VAYATLLEAERRNLHRRVARALERRYVGRLDEVYGLLAYHWDAAREDDLAVHFLVRAGDKARGEYADEDALRHYTRAAELMKQGGKWQAAADTLMKAALAHHIAFDFVSADRAYKEAFQILQRVPAPPLPGRPSATMRWAMLEPATPDMSLAADTRSAYLAEQVFEGLLVDAPDLNVAPGVARAWEISEDGRRYLFHLHPEHRWSDGHPVTAGDFVYSWLRAMRGVRSHSFFDIVGAKRYADGTTDDPAAVGVRALDDRTLEVMLNGPRAYFPFILSQDFTLPHPRWAIERYGPDWVLPGHLVANGPYVLASWEKGRSLRLVANSSYRSRRGNVAEVRWVVASPHDPTPYEQREVDGQRLSGGIGDETAARLRDDVQVLAPYASNYIAFRCDRPPFDDRRLRLAFAHALDRRLLARSVGAYAVPADGGYVPPALPGHSPHIGLPLDPERARGLLAAAGFPEGRGLGPLTLAAIRGIHDELYEIAVGAWREVLGVEISVVRFPSASEYYLQKSYEPADLHHSSWVPGYPDPDYFLRSVFPFDVGDQLGTVDERALRRPRGGSPVVH
jgi:oligopeptide transport system substrate-binding protein